MKTEIQKYCVHCRKFVFTSNLFNDDTERCCECENQIGWGSLNKVCAICGTEFESPYNTKYCSDKCRLYNILNKPPSNFRIFLRDNFTCQYCGKTVADGIKLHVDHIFPINKHGGYDNHNLITACNECNSSKSDLLLDKDVIMKFWDVASENDKKCNYENLQEEWLKQKT